MTASRRLRTSLYSLTVLSFVTGSAMAQTATAPAPASPSPAQDARPGDQKSKDNLPQPSNDTTSVTVKGRKSSIDRQSYDVSKLPDSQTGSASDLLNKVPGVNVDANGDVTYRGKSVTIYYNGHPSLMLQGDNRAIALQSMPASYVSSIEVISNPGAQFSSSSDGGAILNIVTKHDLPPGVFGSLHARLSSPGGFSSAGPYITFHAGKLTVMGSLNYNSSDRPSHVTYATQRLDATGQPSTANMADTFSRSRSHGPSTFSNFEYDLTPNDILTGQESYSSSTSRSASAGENLTLTGPANPTEAYDSSNSNSSHYDSAALILGWTHYGQKPDETLKVTNNASDSLSSRTSRSTGLYTASVLPANLATPRVTQSSGKSATHKNIINIDYNAPVGRDQLASGLEFSQQSDRSDTQFVTLSGLGAGTSNPLLSNRVADTQTQAAAYVTWQREFGAHWTVLGGLRLESAGLEANRVSDGTSVRTGYTHLNPSLFATDLLSDNARLRFSYTHRLQLPRPGDLIPAVVYNDANHISAGNPTLKPQETDAFEANYDFTGKTQSLGLHGFYHQDSRILLTSSFFVPDPLGAGNLVLETTRGNFGTSHSAGLEVTWSKRYGKVWSLSADATLSTTDLRSADINRLPVVSLGGRFTVNYNPTTKDSLSLSYMPSGKRLSGEGYTMPSSQSSLSYNRTLARKLFLVLSVSDMLRESKMQTITRTRTYDSTFAIANRAPTFSISLNRSFGGLNVITKVQ